MKVIHFAPTLQSGGATRLAADLAYALQVYDVQNLLVSPRKGKGLAPTSAQLRHVAYHPYPVPGLWGHVLKLRGMISARRPDIVQAYGYEAITIAAKACRMVPEAHRPKLVGALVGYPPGAEALHAPELQACAAVTVVSKHLRQHLKKENPSLIKSWVIPYGVNETLCYPTYSCSQEWQQSWLAEHPELQGRFVVCVPGPISAMHGTLDIIPIAATLLQQEIPVQMLLTGDPALADQDYIATLRRRARSSGIEQLISWVKNARPLRDIMCS